MTVLVFYLLWTYFYVASRKPSIVRIIYELNYNNVKFMHKTVVLTLYYHHHTNCVEIGPTGINDIALIDSFIRQYGLSD